MYSIVGGNDEYLIELTEKRKEHYLTSHKITPDLAIFHNKLSEMINC